MTELLVTERSFDELIIGKFTAKELIIFELIAQGLSNRAIAKKLNLSKYTINTHANHIFQKLNVEDRSTSTLRVKVSLVWHKYKEQIKKSSVLSQI